MFYGHLVTDLRYFLWQLLKYIGLNRLEPWLCLGDFNDILFQHEKTGGLALCNSAQMEAFHDGSKSRWFSCYFLSTIWAYPWPLCNCARLGKFSRITVTGFPQCCCSYFLDPKNSISPNGCGLLPISSILVIKLCLLF